MRAFWAVTQSSLLQSTARLEVASAGFVVLAFFATYLRLPTQRPRTLRLACYTSAYGGGVSAGRAGFSTAPHASFRSCRCPEIPVMTAASPPYASTGRYSLRPYVLYGLNICPGLRLGTEATCRVYCGMATYPSSLTHANGLAGTCPGGTATPVIVQASARHVIAAPLHPLARAKHF
jgi:hypothetical protein